MLGDDVGQPCLLKNESCCFWRGFNEIKILGRKSIAIKQNFQPDIKMLFKIDNKS